MWALSETVRYAQSKGMIVIMDGKRNDIGSTMQAYAKAHLGTTALRDQQQAAFGSDMLTVNAISARTVSNRCANLRREGQGHLCTGENLQSFLRRASGPEDR